LEKLDCLLLKFKEQLKTKGFSERSIASYEQNVRYFLNYLKELEITNINEVDKRLLLQYQTFVHTETHKEKPLSSSTQSVRLIAVRSFYSYLLKYGYILRDHSQDLNLPKQPNQLPRDILTKKEIGKLLSAPDLETPLGIRDRTILEVLYSTGIRTTELCNLTITDIDLNHGELRVNLGKGAKDRIVPLGEMASEYLELYLKESRPKLVKDHQNLLFITKNGEQIKRSYLSYIVKKHCQEAGLTKIISPHALRHTCATHLLKGKADIRHIQAILGHATIASTQKYTRVEITDLKQVMKRCHPRCRKEIETHDI
jgi:integrase/recombinase XerD